jgi:hypothetical protein
VSLDPKLDPGGGMPAHKIVTITCSIASTVMNRPAGVELIGGRG